MIFLKDNIDTTPNKKNLSEEQKEIEFVSEKWGYIRNSI